MPETRFKRGIPQIGRADINRHRILIAAPGRRLPRLIKAVAAPHRHFANQQLRVERTAMDSDTVTLRGDNTSHMRAVAVCISKPSSGEIAVADERRHKVGM